MATEDLLPAGEANCRPLLKGHRSRIGVVRTGVVSGCVKERRWNNKGAVLVIPCCGPTSVARFRKLSFTSFVINDLGVHTTN